MKKGFYKYAILNYPLLVFFRKWGESEGTILD